MTRALLLVFIGGGIGSMLRYCTSWLILRYYQQQFPIATLIANVVGCLLIGVLISLLGRSPTAQTDIKFLMITGFCGGYTTFSAFASENIMLMQSGQLSSAMLYTIMSVVLCLLAVWCGMLLVLLF